MYISFSCCFHLWLLQDMNTVPYHSRTLLFISPKYTSFHLPSQAPNPSLSPLTLPPVGNQSCSLYRTATTYTIQPSCTLILLIWLDIVSLSSIIKVLGPCFWNHFILSQNPKSFLKDKTSSGGGKNKTTNPHRVHQIKIGRVDFSVLVCSFGTYCLICCEDAQSQEF